MYYAIRLFLVLILQVNLMKDNNRNINNRISMIEKYTQLYFPNSMIMREDEILEV